jgi:Ca-activated chloride channel homolog
VSFTWPAMLWALTLLPLTAALLWAAARRRARRREAFADPHLLGAVTRRAPRTLVGWSVGLQLFALTALLVAAARPVASPRLPVNVAAVVLALDASLSMLADDVDPNRLEVARELAAAFVRQAPASTRIGLVSFSDAATTLVPPTTDREALHEGLHAVQPAANTSLSAAIVTGVRALPGRERAPVPDALRAPGTSDDSDTGAAPDIAADLTPAGIVIFSDGGDNVAANPGVPGDLALELAARFAADHEVPVYTVPVGRDGGAVSEIDGQLYFVPYDPASLARVAALSGGEQLDARDHDAVAAVFRELQTAIRWRPTEVEVSSPLAATALLTMLLGAVLSLRWQRRVP